MGGTLVKNLSEVEVECLPADLPPNFEVDVSSLNTFEDAIRVSDLKVEDGVTLLSAPEEVIATVAPPRSEEEMKSLEEAVTEDVTKVEGVIKPDPGATDAVPGTTDDKAADKPAKAGDKPAKAAKEEK